MILAIDQYGNKTLLPDAKINTLLDKFGYTSTKPMYRDINKIPHKVGYVLTHRGYNALWVELFEIKPAFIKGDDYY